MADTDENAEADAPADAPPDAPPLTARERSRTRGYVTEFGRGRTCIAPGCETVLSRYNSGDLCWVHDDRSRASGGGG